jgi:hypothetical protein
VKPYLSCLKVALVFGAGFLACLLWDRFTQNYFAIVSDQYGRQLMINQRNGDTWCLNGTVWVKNSRIDNPPQSSPHIGYVPPNPYLEEAHKRTNGDIFDEIAPSQR